MKHHKLLPSLHLCPLSMCHLHSIFGQWSMSTDRPSFSPGEMRCSWAVPGPSPLVRRLYDHYCCLLVLFPQHRGHFLFPLSVIFSQRLCHALLWWGTCRFFKTGLEVLSATRGSHNPLQYWVFLIKRNNNIPHTYLHDMFGSLLIFQPWCKFYELFPLKRLPKSLAINVVWGLWSPTW